MTEALSAGRHERTTATAPVPLRKALTGIQTLDDVTDGGLPQGRTTLLAGAAGSGKTLLAIEFLVHGALEFGEPGVLLAFEESEADLVANVASLGFDLERMQEDGLLAIDAVHLDAAHLTQTGEYNLDGLFCRLGLAVESVGAKRVVLDSVEVMFGSLDATTVRSELYRLFEWLKERDLTAIVTGEKGDGLITRHGIEEYVSDCVITLDHRVHEQVSNRRLRVVKYRGSVHGTQEYPFVITEGGIVVLPVTSAHLDHAAPVERIVTGIPRLDEMLGGGLYGGSSLLIGGEAGTGKTALAAKMLEVACARGERGLFVSLEESPAQLFRNMSSVGIDLKRWVDAGLLRIWAARPDAYGLEMHLVMFLRQVEEFAPSIVALDAMASLNANVTSLVVRKIDYLKRRGITAIVTSLLQPGLGEMTNVTSLMDTCILIRNTLTNGEQNRLLSVRKSRGTAHSNQVRELVLSHSGFDLLDMQVPADDGALSAAGRLTSEAEERVAVLHRADVIDRRHRGLVRLHTEALAQVHALQACLDAEQPDSERIDPHDEHWLRVVERPDGARGAPSVADYVEGIPPR